MDFFLIFLILHKYSLVTELVVRQLSFKHTLNSTKKYHILFDFIFYLMFFELQLLSIKL